MAGTLVVAELVDGKVRKSTLSAITFAKQVGGPFSILAIGAGAAGAAKELASYGAAKVIAIDHAEQNVRCNALSPGAVETRRTLLRYNSFEAANETLGAKHLTKRLGKPHELAQAAVFLASDAASFVTGSDLLVDGGYTAV